MSRNCSTPLGTITVAQAALAATSSRKASALETSLTDANHLVLDAQHLYNEFLELTFHAVGSANDVNVVEVYAARGLNDDYVHVSTLSLIVGTAIVRGVGASLYHDSIDITRVDGSFEMAAFSLSGNEQAKLYMNTNGYSRFMFIVSTKGSTSVTVETAVLDRQHIPDGILSSSTTGGVQKLTIASNVIVGTAQPCKSVLIKPDSGNTGTITLNIGATADANDYPIDATSTPVPIDDCSKLNFYSGTNGDIVYVLWRN